MVKVNKGQICHRDVELYKWAKREKGEVEALEAPPRRDPFLQRATAPPTSSAQGGPTWGEMDDRSS